MDSTAIHFLPSQGFSFLFLVTLVGAVAFVVMFSFLIFTAEDREGSAPAEAKRQSSASDPVQSGVGGKGRRP